MCKMTACISLATTTTTSRRIILTSRQSPLHVATSSSSSSSSSFALNEEDVTTTFHAPPESIVAQRRLSRTTSDSSRSSSKRHDDAHNYDNNNNTIINPHVQFVVVLGLEGTGHHLIRKLASHAPAVLEEQQQATKRKKKKKKAPAHSAQNVMSALQHVWDAVWKINQPDLDVQSLYDDLVRQLQRAARRINTNNQPTTTTRNIFLNAEGNMKLWSYPQGSSPTTRLLTYPDMDLFYAACHDAAVRCGHVYLYRDPAAILRSNVAHRSFNPTWLSAMATYTTMTSVLYGQLAAHGHRTLGCWGFYESADQQQEQQLWSHVQSLMGWTDPVYFESTIKSKYYQPPNATTTTTTIVPSSQNVSMTAFRRVYQQTLDLCRSQVREQNGATEGSL